MIIENINLWSIEVKFWRENFARLLQMLINARQTNKRLQLAEREKPEDLTQDKKKTSLMAFEKLKVYADCRQAVMYFYLLDFEHEIKIDWVCEKTTN